VVIIRFLLPLPPHLHIEYPVLYFCSCVCFWDAFLNYQTSLRHESVCPIVFASVKPVRMMHEMEIFTCQYYLDTLDLRCATVARCCL